MYFVGRKRVKEEEFDKLWEVMSEKEYETKFQTTLQNRQMGKLKYKWWKDEHTNPDIDKF